jgi:hypothetical protein
MNDAPPSSPCILGIDPGLTAFLFPQHDRVDAEDMPTVGVDVAAASLVERIRQMDPGLAVIEIAAARPKQGVSSVFRYGAGYGAVLGVIAALAIPVHLVSATKWKRALSLDADKERSRALALRLWPARADLFGRKRDHGRAEAALIARYGAEKIIGGSP